MRSFLGFVFVCAFVFSTVVVVCGVLFGLLSFWEFLAHRAGVCPNRQTAVFCVSESRFGCGFFCDPSIRIIIP